MYPYKLTYTDFDGNERTETFYFNYTKAEVSKKQLLTPGTWTGNLQKKKDGMDVTGLIGEFEDFVLDAYGEKSEDGKRFVKNAQIREDFASSAAFPEIYIKLMTDKDAALEFVMGVMPIDDAQKAQVKSSDDFKKLIDAADNK